MSDSVGKKAKKGIQDLAQGSFEKIKQEPGEVVRSAGDQLTGLESSPSKVPSEASQVAEEKRKEEKDKQKSERLMSAHQKELQDIKKAEVFRETQKKIQQGEAVNISAIPGLSEEQKSILRAQRETLEESRKKQKEATEKSKGVVEPSTKRKRGIFQKAKSKVQQMKTRIETKFKSVG